ncbi:RNA-binding protein [Candidatus Bathyarchaeota archaeon]|nr:RNA-binding protein [Candidatus Bathyarchaeota archaeon]
MPSKIGVERVETERATIYLVDGEPILAKVNNRLIPTLRFSQALSSLPSVIVNMGAVPAICNGADVMAPGVVATDGDFQEGKLVVVRDERHRKLLALGIALVNKAQIASSDRGKVVMNIHYVGDWLWKLMKELEKSRFSR